ncbi:MAG: CHASE2 domain-containing protein [Betaproteobacteria bacterium]|nr:CHASE2 domain-containing protein [Betaproteobacteria bacterium]
MKIVARLRHPVIREWLAILLALCLLAFFAQRGEWFWRVDQTLYDSSIGLIQRPAQSEIVIVGVDEQSLKQIGRWPWKRGIHATILNRLTEAGAKVVMFDVILSEADRLDPMGDRVLAAAIKANGRVILPIATDAVDGVSTGEAPPAPEFATAAAGLSHISLELDPDGVLRSVYLRSGIGEARHDISSLAALRIAEPARWPATVVLPGESNPRRTAFSRAWVRDNWYHVPFAGPPGHFRTIAYVDVLRGDVPAAAFKDKIVLVGVTASGLRDEYPTPVSGRTRAMSGIEVQANILQGLREGIDIRLVSMTASVLVACALILLLMFSYLWLTPRRALAATGLMCVAVFAGPALLFRYQLLWLSPAVPLLGLLLAYPLWSWRKLEATQRYFDAELARLEREPSIVPEETARSISPRSMANTFVPDVIENRIAALQATTERFRNLNRFVADSLESLPDAALVTDAEGRILLANSSADRIFKSRRKATERAVDRPLEGRDLFEQLTAFRHEAARSWRDIWMDVHDETRMMSLEAKGPDDREYLVQIAPAFSARGTQTGSIVTLTDISPLRETERRRDEALRFLSHDMRSPQASIITLLDMYHDDPAGMPIPKLTDRIGKYARRTLNLADDFLRLAKAERVNSRDFEPLNLCELLRDAVDEAWSTATAKEISIELDIAQEESWVSGDRDLLTRAMMNLLSNAIKYSPPRTTIRCTLSAGLQTWCVRIADQGYGIAETDLPKLFTRFTRLKHNTQPEEDGIGLGLVFVKTVVERHGGAIGVQSKVAASDGDTHGTTFTLTLDAVVAPAD